MATRLLVSAVRDAQRLSATILGCGWLCAALFLATVPLPHADYHIVGSDGIRYYAITRSLVFDRDLDFADDYRLLGAVSQPTATGRPANAQGMGSSILWLPFFLVAHVAALAVHRFGLPVSTNGGGNLYESAACLGTVVYATLGVLVTARTLGRAGVADRGVGGGGLLGVWGAAPAVYYPLAEP